jgi:Sulfotransferase family
MEERPPLTRVEQELGGIRHLAELNDKDVTSLRALYFEEADKWVERRPDALLVDKFPLHLNKVPIVHRLFPDARFILALRHPCDVVLSCFITNFRLNNAMANFIDLGITAEVYDLSFGFWEQCRRIMPIDVHSVSYERMVEESEAELRPLFDYLGLDWRDEVLDHRQTASERGMISTASYAQVTEPIYKRAAGRWTRYRAQLEPVLPTLKPWVEKLGYTL